MENPQFFIIINMQAQKERKNPLVALKIIITFRLGIYIDVTSGGKLCLLLFVGTWERKLSPQKQTSWEEKKKKKEEQVTNMDMSEVAVYSSTMQVDVLSPWIRSFVSTPLSGPPREQVDVGYGFPTKGGVCFAARDHLVRPVSCALRTLIANG